MFVILITVANWKLVAWFCLTKRARKLLKQFKKTISVTDGFHCFNGTKRNKYTEVFHKSEKKKCYMHANSRPKTSKDFYSVIT